MHVLWELVDVNGIQPLNYVFHQLLHVLTHIFKESINLIIYLVQLAIMIVFQLEMDVIHLDHLIYLVGFHLIKEFVNPKIIFVNGSMGNVSLHLIYL